MSSSPSRSSICTRARHECLKAPTDLPLRRSQQATVEEKHISFHNQSRRGHTIRRDTATARPEARSRPRARRAPGHIPRPRLGRRLVAPAEAPPPRAVRADAPVLAPVTSRARPASTPTPTSAATAAPIALVVAPSLERVEQAALPRPDLAVFFEDFALLEAGEDDVAYALFGEEGVDEFVDESEAVAA